MKRKILLELQKEFRNLRITDIVYRVDKTEIKKLNLKSIESEKDYLVLSWGDYRSHRIRVFPDNSIKKHDYNKWIDASDEFFLQEWKAKRQVNINIGKAVHKKWSRIKDLNKEIKELKSKYFIEVK